MYIKFTSPKRSKLNDVGLRVVQSSCTVTAISKFKSTTASLSVSTASLQPTQQQMLLWSTVQLKIFMASFPLHVRMGAVLRDLFPRVIGSDELHLYLHTNPRTAGLEPDFGRSSRLKRMLVLRDHECHQWLYNGISFLASDSSGMHVNYGSGNINDGPENYPALLLELLNAVFLSTCKSRTTSQKYPYS